MDADLFESSFKLYQDTEIINTFCLHNIRSMLLTVQGLATPPVGKPTKKDVLATIRQMGLLQLDTISVVARSQYLVLWSRLGAYEPRWLDDLLTEGAVFEYWAHAACVLPIEDYRIYRRRMLDYADNGHYMDRLEPGISEAIVRTLDHIREHGAVRSNTFKDTREKAGTWWDWSPEKRALEHLFNAGIVMILKRIGFQRVYDLSERVFPIWDDRNTCTREEGMRAMVVKAVKALGAAPARWLVSYYPDYLRSRTAKRDISHILKELTQDGVLFEVAVEGWREAAYMHKDHLDLAAQALNDALHSSVTTFLSPFDPIVSDRARVEDLFGFSYRIETYTPVERRRYGYFTLPILHQGALVGRMDAKAHRQAGIFEVKALHLEAGEHPSESLTEAVAARLREFANWHGTPNIKIGYCDLPFLVEILRGENRQIEHY
jgi:uncharacterized protein